MMLRSLLYCLSVCIAIASHSVNDSIKQRSYNRQIVLENTARYQRVILLNIYDSTTVSSAEEQKKLFSYFENMDIGFDYTPDKNYNQGSVVVKTFYYTVL